MECQNIKIAFGDLTLELAFQIVQIEVAVAVTLTAHDELVAEELGLHVDELVNVTLVLLTKCESADGGAGVGRVYLQLVLWAVQSEDEDVVVIILHELYARNVGGAVQFEVHVTDDRTLYVK